MHVNTSPKTAILVKPQDVTQFYKNADFVQHINVHRLVLFFDTVGLSEVTCCCFKYNLQKYKY